MQLQLDRNRDIQIGADGQLVLTPTFGDTLKQRVECRLRTFRGELFMDRGVGVPYFEEFQSKSPNVNSISMLLRSEVMAVDGVVSVDSMSVTFDREARVFHVDMSIHGATGEPVEVTI